MNILEKIRQGTPLANLKSELRLSAERSSGVRTLFEGAPRTVIVPPKAASLFAVKQTLADLLQAQKKKHGSSGGSREIERIIALPTFAPLAPEELEAYCRDNILRPAFNEGFRLKVSQAEAFLAYDQIPPGSIEHGVFCPIGAGAGKTLIDVGIASRAYVKGIHRILLLIPSVVYYQFVARSLPFIRSKIPVEVPFIFMGNTTKSKRLDMAHSNRSGCYVLPYSCLSTRDSVELLESIHPGLIIADEAHRLANRRAARSRRISAYMLKNPSTEFVPLSGTMTNKSIKEYHHLISWALRRGSPLPVSGQMAAEWGMFIDSKAEYTGGSAGPIGDVVEWARKNFPSVVIQDEIHGFRTAFRLRLVSAPGVVATADTDVACSLYLANAPVPHEKEGAPWKRLDELTQGVTNFITPNGDTIEHALHTFRWMYELSAGFYNELVWPTSEEYAKRRSISLEAADDIIRRAQIHHDLSQLFAKEARKWMSTHSTSIIDTPLLLRSDLKQHGHKNVGRNVYDAWQDMHAADFAGRPDRDSHVVRVCDYKIMAAVAWAKGLDKDKGAVIWAHNQEIVSWVFEEVSKALGKDRVVHAPAGEAANQALVDLRNEKKVFCASIQAHGEGKELQHFQHQYYVQWPRSARQAEQVLARLHRLGQTADEITAHTNNTTLFDQMCFAACLIDALYIQQTTGNRQRIIYAGYDPLPVIFPPSVLRERGMNNKMLSTEHQRALSDLFGNFNESGASPRTK